MKEWFEKRYYSLRSEMRCAKRGYEKVPCLRANKTKICQKSVSILKCVKEKGKKIYKDNTLKKLLTLDQP